jgi:hypothetical protein
MKRSALWSALLVLGILASLGSSSALASSHCIPAPVDLVSWWPGDGNANDMADGNSGILMNGAGFADGKVASAFSLDGVDDFVTVPDAANLDVTGQITIDAWVKPSRSHLGPIVDKWGANDGYSLTFRGDMGGVVQGRIGTRTGFPVVNSNRPIPVNQFSHVAMTYDGHTLRIFVNGVLAGTKSIIASIASNDEGLRIGRNKPTARFKYFFAGLIDEVEIFNRALSEEEIKAIYDAGSAGKCKSTSVEIDIKPGSDPNAINCNNERGVIPVAILTTPGFDATRVDHSTVSFEGASETHGNRKTGEPRRHQQDVDADGDTDLVFHFRLGDTGLTCNAAEGTLTGETFDGVAITGTDSVRMIDAGGGKP